MKLLITISLAFTVLNSSGQYHMIDPDVLSWNNFTGKVDSIGWTAFTASRLKLKYNRTNAGIIDAVYSWVEFDNDKSYLNTEKFNNLNDVDKFGLFIHEKNHYLLNIYHAKMMKYFIQLNPTMTDSAVTNYFINSKYQAFFAQSEYDNLSNHSRNFDGQNKWNLKIDSSLKKYITIVLKEYFPPVNVCYDPADFLQLRLP